MYISALGASSLQALTSSWTGATPLSSADSQDPLGFDSDSVSLSAAGSLALFTQGQDPFRADFDKLGALLESGDLAGAKALFKAMQERLQARPGRGPEDIENGFKALARALESGDAAAAKAAWADLGQALQAFAPGGGSPLQRDLQSLGKLIEAGDTSAAKDLLQDILKKLQRGPGGDRATLQPDFSALSSALDSGDLQAARSALDTLQQDLRSAAAQRASRRGTDLQLDMLLLTASWQTRTGSGTSLGQD